MKPAIQAKARELGFDLCRVASALPPDSAGRFAAWLEAGRHGEMAYLARNPAKRADPTLVLPGARSVICLAATYPAPEAAPPPAGSGVIAR